MAEMMDPDEKDQEEEYTVKKYAKLVFIVLLAAALVAALAALGFLWAENADLKKQLESADEYVLVVQENADLTINVLTGQLTEAQGAVTTLQADLAAVQLTLAETEAALTGMTAAKAEADAQIAALTAELEACTAELAAVTAEKESADAALAALGFTRIQPQVVEPVAEEPAAAEDPAGTEEPVTEEGISEVPGEAFEAAPEADNSHVSVYTVEAMGVAFEAPVSWIIAEDSDTSFVLRETERRSGVYTALVITVQPAETEDEGALNAYLAANNGMQPDGGVPAELMGHPGLYSQETAEDPTGVPYTRRVHAVIVDGVLYAVSITAAPEVFDAALNEVFLPACTSMRMIP